MAPQQEWFEKDYYKVLGVPDDADQKEITKAYRKLARENHPDANPGDTAAEERFKEVSAAYDVVGDADKRKEYDEVRRSARWAACSAAVAARPAAASAARRLHVHHRGPRRRARRHPRQPVRPRRRAGRRQPRHRPAAGRRPRGRAAPVLRRRGRGHHHHVHLTSDATCSTCHGSGARPGTSPIVCPQCAGRGVIDDNQGLFSFSSPCPRCAGHGMIVEDPCPTCHGSGVERRPARGQGPHPGRRHRRPAHPAEGPRRPGSQRRPARRPLRHLPRRAARRSSACDGQRPHPHRAGHVPRGRARRRHHGAHPRRRHGQAARPGRHPHRAHVPGEGPRRARRRRAPATCWSPSRSPCRPSCRRPSARRSRRSPPRPTSPRGPTWG